MISIVPSARRAGHISILLVNVMAGKSEFNPDFKFQPTKFLSNDNYADHKCNSCKTSFAIRFERCKIEELALAFRNDSSEVVFHRVVTRGGAKLGYS